jgi:SAM-dependent methyltransferase
MPPPNPPAFSDLKYWDNRFSSTSTPFDWLVSANSLDSLVLASIRSISGERCKILHIGCGSSELSFRLGELAGKREDVWNTDYSRVVIEQGRAIEEDCLSPTPPASTSTVLDARPPATGHEEPSGRMNWKVLDLLSVESITAFRAETKSESFDLIVDKSTSDAISCGPDLPLPDSDASISSRSAHTILLHPLELLALNLARLTRPGGRWICISYSSDRFEFLHQGTSSRTQSGNDGSTLRELEASRCWRLEHKEEIEVETQPERAVDAGIPEGGGVTARMPVFRPKQVNYSYILVRTDVLFEP